MRIQKKLIRTERRNFLGKCALAGGAAVASTGVSQAAVAEGPSLTAEPSISQGYSETSHVQAYYKRARF